MMKVRCPATSRASGRIVSGSISVIRAARSGVLDRQAAEQDDGRGVAADRGPGRVAVGKTFAGADDAGRMTSAAAKLQFCTEWVSPPTQFRKR